MNDKNLEKIILSIFIRDLIRNNKHTSNTQVCLLTIKSLLPSEIEVGNYIDYKRFFEEIKLWRFYKEGNITNLYKSLSNVELKDSYYEQDRDLYLRIIPIIVANQDYEILEREVIKNILFTSGNIKSLFKGLILAKYIDLKYNNLDIIDNLKKYIINFSQKSYREEYQSLYRLGLENYKSFTIEFEKEKINILNVLNGIDIKEYELIKDLIRIESKDYKEVITLEGKIIRDGLICEEDDFLELDRFYLDMADYLLRLRNSRISPDILKIRNYILPNVFNYKQGEKFYHSILNDCLVLKKEVRQDSLTSIIKNKSGIYTFRKSL